MVGDKYTLCPKCNSPFVRRCKCQLGERVCENGHIYHHCIVHGFINRKSNHGNRTTKCSCIEIKKEK